MRLTIGNIFLISRWFLEPTIFLMIKLIMLLPLQVSRENLQSIAWLASRKGNCRAWKLVGKHPTL
jgi:hypothetical protein